MKKQLFFGNLLLTAMLASKGRGVEPLRGNRHRLSPHRWQWLQVDAFSGFLSRCQRKKNLQQFELENTALKQYTRFGKEVW